MEGRIQTLFFLIIVFQCGGIYGTASSVSPCGPVYHTFEFATLQQVLGVFWRISISRKCTVCPLCSLVIATGFATCSPSSFRMCSGRIPPYTPPSPPSRWIICSNAGPSLLGKPGATVSMSSIYESLSSVTAVLSNALYLVKGKEIHFFFFFFLSSSGGWGKIKL